MDLPPQRPSQSSPPVKAKISTLKQIPPCDQLLAQIYTKACLKLQSNITHPLINNIYDFYQQHPQPLSLTLSDRDLHIINHTTTYYNLVYKSSVISKKGYLHDSTKTLLCAISLLYPTIEKLSKVTLYEINTKFLQTYYDIATNNSLQSFDLFNPDKYPSVIQILLNYVDTSHHACVSLINYIVLYKSIISSPTLDVLKSFLHHASNYHNKHVLIALQSVLKGSQMASSNSILNHLSTLKNIDHDEDLFSYENDDLERLSQLHTYIKTYTRSQASSKPHIPSPFCIYLHEHLPITENTENSSLTFTKDTSFSKQTQKTTLTITNTLISPSQETHNHHTTLFSPQHFVKSHIIPYTLVEEILLGAFNDAFFHILSQSLTGRELSVHFDKTLIPLSAEYFYNFIEKRLKYYFPKNSDVLSELYPLCHQVALTFYTAPPEISSLFNTTPRKGHEQQRKKILDLLHEQSMDKPAWFSQFSTTNFFKKIFSVVNNHPDNIQSGHPYTNNIIKGRVDVYMDKFNFIYNDVRFNKEMKSTFSYALSLQKQYITLYETLKYELSGPITKKKPQSTTIIDIDKITALKLQLSKIKHLMKSAKFKYLPIIWPYQYYSNKYSQPLVHSWESKTTTKKLKKPISSTSPLVTGSEKTINSTLFLPNNVVTTETITILTKSIDLNFFENVYMLNSIFTCDSQQACTLCYNGSVNDDSDVYGVIEKKKIPNTIGTVQPCVSTDSPHHDFESNSVACTPAKVNPFAFEDNTIVYFTTVFSDNFNTKNEEIQQEALPQAVPTKKRISKAITQPLVNPDIDKNQLLNIPSNDKNIQPE